MIDKCPKCGNHSLSYDRQYETATCYIKECGFIEEDLDEYEYYEKYADKTRYSVPPKKTNGYVRKSKVEELEKRLESLEKAVKELKNKSHIINPLQPRGPGSNDYGRK
jgi:hypothetical protein